MTGTAIQSLLVAKDGLDVLSSNLERLSDPSARRVDATVSIDPVGSNGTAYRTKLVETRSVDPLLEKAYVKQTTGLDNSNVYTEFLRDLQTVIAGDKNSQKSGLVGAVDSFFAQAKLLEADSSGAMRVGFIKKAQGLASTISSATRKVDELRFEADKQLHQKTLNLNNSLKQLFDINQAMLSSQNPQKFYDKRDALVRDIASNFDVNVIYGRSGTALISVKPSGTELTGNGSYAQITYDGVPSIDAIIDNVDRPEMMITSYDTRNLPGHTSVFAGGSDNPEILPFSGGTWGALVDLRDNRLPQTGNIIKSLGANLSRELNRIHNSGSPFPPKGLFESTIKIGGLEQPDWGDPFSVYFVDSNGSQLFGGQGPLNKAVIDMRSIAAGSPTGRATVADLIKELNEKLDSAPSRPRAAIGAITTDANAAVQIPGQYLVNNIQLRAKTGVNPGDGSFTFDLDLQGSSHFSSKIEILDARTTDVGGANAQVVAQGNLPDEFDLAKDTNTATGKNIRVAGAGANRVITLTVRVTGENGVVQEGTVSFRANPAINYNERITFDGTLAGAIGGSFVMHQPLVPVLSHSGVARAKLVDDNGFEIDPTSGQMGRLVIQTNTDSYRLAIQDGNFSSMFGFNNFFNFDQRTGAMSLRDDIADDPSKLALGRAKQGAAVATAHTVGDATAQGTLTFAGVPNMVANGTVTVAGRIFTFVAGAPANSQEVQIGGNLQITLDNLRNAINNDRVTKNLVVADPLAGVNSFILKAKAAGVGGNNLNISWNFNLAGPTLAYVNAAAVPVNIGAADANGATPLGGGTNKVATSPVLDYTLKPANQDVLEELSSLQTTTITLTDDLALPNTSATLAGIASIVTGMLSNDLNEARTKSDIAKNVLTQTDKAVRQQSGISKEREYLKVMDQARLLTTLANLMAQVQNTIVKVEDILFR